MKTLFSTLRLAVASLFLVLGAAQLQAAELANGAWDNQEYKISGTWKIVEEGGKAFIELDEAFKTRRAPDLKIFLSRLPAAEVTSNNAVSSSVFVAKLDKARGGQRYELPEGVNIADFKSVVIHCQQFTKLWGAGNIKAEQVGS